MILYGSTVVCVIKNPTRANSSALVDKANCLIEPKSKDIFDRDRPHRRWNVPTHREDVHTAQPQTISNHT